MKLNPLSDRIVVKAHEAEEKEKESNQIIEFTKEIKKHPMEFRLKIVEILWNIVYSDNANDSYESN